MLEITDLVKRIEKREAFLKQLKQSFIENGFSSVSASLGRNSENKLFWNISFIDDSNILYSFKLLLKNNELPYSNDITKIITDFALKYKSDSLQEMIDAENAYANMSEIKNEIILERCPNQNLSNGDGRFYHKWFIDVNGIEHTILVCFSALMAESFGLNLDSSTKFLKEELKKLDREMMNDRLRCYMPIEMYDKPNLIGRFQDCGTYLWVPGINDGIQNNKFYYHEYPRLILTKYIE